MTGRRRIDNGLPNRLYVHHGKKGDTYYTITRDNQYIGLGGDLAKATKAAAEINKKKTDFCPEQSAKELMRKATKSARGRKIDISITEEHLLDLLKASGGRCAVTGMRFSSKPVDGQRVRPYTPSVDRIDSAIGYIPGNVRIVCAAVNLALNQFGDAFLLSLIAGMKKLSSRHAAS